MTDQRVSRQRTGQHHEYDDGSECTDSVKDRLKSPSWLARIAGIGLSIVSIGFVVLFMFVLETGGELTLFTKPLSMQLALALPYLIGILTVGTTVGALLAWRRRYWSLRVRIHQTILALLGLIFSWQLSALGFIAV